MPEPIASLGHNNPPLSERLQIDYASVLSSVVDLSASASATPRELESEDDVSACAEIVKRARSIKKDLEDARTDAGKPFLEAKRTVDDFFRKPVNDVDAVVKPLITRIDGYRRKIEEQERLRKAQEAEEHRRRMAELTQAATEQSGVVQDVLVQSATAAGASYEQQRGEALQVTKQAPMRTSGGTVGVRKSFDFLIEDRSALLASQLIHNFIDMGALEQAVRKFMHVMKPESGGLSLPGVRIFETTKTVVR
jgi:hypothetical protein